jgi:hypothetical protein
MPVKIPFTRLPYQADYSSLTKRMGFPVRHYAMYRKHPAKKTERHALKRTTYFPKYSHYINRNSNLYLPREQIQDCQRFSAMSAVILDGMSTGIVYSKHQLLDVSSGISTSHRRYAYQAGSPQMHFNSVHLPVEEGKDQLVNWAK